MNQTFPFVRFSHGAVDVVVVEVIPTLNMLVGMSESHGGGAGLFSAAA